MIALNYLPETWIVISTFLIAFIILLFSKVKLDHFQIFHRNSEILTNFHQLLTSSHLNNNAIKQAMGLYTKLKDKEKTSLILHTSILNFVFELFRTSDKVLRDQLREFLSIIIQSNIDVNQSVVGSNILNEALIIREVTLAQELVDSGFCSLSSETFIHLYSIVSDILHISNHLVTNNAIACKSLNHSSQLYYLLSKNHNQEKKDTSTTHSTTTNTYRLQHDDLHNSSKHYQKVIKRVNEVVSIDFICFQKDIRTSVYEVIMTIETQLFYTLSMSRELLIPLIKYISKTNAYGQTLFHIIAISGCSNLIKLLTGSGAAVTTMLKTTEIRVLLQTALQTRDYQGHTPLSLASLKYANKEVLLSLRLLGETISLMPSRVKAIELYEIPESVRIIMARDQVASNGNESSMKSHNNESAIRDHNQICLRDSNSSGGWNTKSKLSPSLGIFSKYLCDIVEVLVSPTSELDFLYQYISVREPIIFRGAAKNSLFQQSCQRQIFQAKYEIQSQFTVTQEEEDDSVRHSGSEGGENDVQLFTFATTLKDAPAPDFIAKENVTNVHMYLGQPGAGESAHFRNSSTLDVLSFGAKHWYIFPPQDAFQCALSSVDFIKKYKLAATAAGTVGTFGEFGILSESLQVTQSAGDMLYLPPMWGHMTLLLEESIGATYSLTYVGEASD